MFPHTLRPLFRLKDFTGYINEFHRTTRRKCSLLRTSTSAGTDCKILAIDFCTQQLPKNANVFGDISGRKFERVEMDELEQKEEDFQDTEAVVPRRLKPSQGQYGKMIKSHLFKKDLDSALEVLDLVKKNRDKPTIYMYNLLLRAISMQGDLKRCFRLYNKAKQHGLQPNAATYTCLFNACATSDKSEVALEHLNELRRSLYEQQFPLNQTHYNVMVKAYSWHNQVIEAFSLVDEMKDNRIAIGDSTYNSLFHGAIADKEAGLRYAMVLWHLMRRWKIKPTLITYNLLLRTIRDTNFGELKIDDPLLCGYEQTRILFREGERPDLLASPPVLSTLLPSMEAKRSITQSDTSTNRQIVPQKGFIDLNHVLAGNRLILFGGMEGFLNRMAEDNVKPDAKTITLFLDIIPNTTAVENLLIQIANEKKIELDIDFYNMLIKKRSMRFDYKAAKEVISMVERKGLSPNVMTFGVLALGCQERDSAAEFLEGMKIFGYRPNAIIMSTLIKIACLKKNFGYLLFVMNYMVKNRMRPNDEAVKDLKEFLKKIPNIEKPVGKYSQRKLRRLEENIDKFQQEYPKWQKMIKE